MALSSNSGAASVPSSVAVPAGATSATFPVNTSAVAAIHSRHLCVLWQCEQIGLAHCDTPPLPTVSSLTLNPTSVITRAILTGAVTLSGPAPAVVRNFAF